MQAESNINTRGRVRTRSTIDEMPTEARAKLDQMLADMGNGLTYQDMAEIMTDDGYKLSKSAIGRYAIRHNAAIMRLKTAQDQTRLLLDYVKDNQDVDAGRVANAIITDGLVRRLSTSIEEFDEMKFSDILKYSIQNQRTSVYTYRYMNQLVSTVKNVQSNFMGRVRQELKEHPEVINILESIAQDVAEEEIAKHDNLG